MRNQVQHNSTSSVHGKEILGVKEVDAEHSLVWTGMSKILNTCLDHVLFTLSLGSS